MFFQEYFSQVFKLQVQYLHEYFTSYRSSKSLSLALSTMIFVVLFCLPVLQHYACFDTCPLLTIKKLNYFLRSKLQVVLANLDAQILLCTQINTYVQIHSKNYASRFAKTTYNLERREYKRVKRMHYQTIQRWNGLLTIHSKRFVWEIWIKLTEFFIPLALLSVVNTL